MFAFEDLFANKEADFGGKYIEDGDYGGVKLIEEVEDSLGGGVHCLSLVLAEVL